MHTVQNIQNTFAARDRLATLSLVVFTLMVLDRGGQTDSAWGLAAAFLLSAGAFLAFQRGKDFFYRTPFVIGMAGLLVWSLFSAARSTCLHASFLSLTKLWTACAFGCVALLGWRGPHRSFFKGLVLSICLLQSVLFLGARMTSQGPVVLFPGNPQYMALWMSVGALLAIGEAFSGRGGLRVFFAALAAGAAWVVFLLPSRSGVAALAVGLGVFLFHRYGRRGVAVFLLVSAIGISLVPVAFWRTLLKSGDNLAWRRWDIWRAAVSGTLERPVLGWGPGQFERLYQKHAVRQDIWPIRLRITTSFAHNDYLQLASEYGLPGVLFMLLFFLGLLQGRFQAGGGATGATLASVAVFCAFNYPLTLPINGLLVAGLLSGLSPVRRFRELAAVRWLGGGLIVFAVLLALMNVSGAAGSVCRRLGNVTWVARLSPLDAEPLIRQADDNIHGPATTPETVARARQLLETAIARCPGLYRPRVELAHALTVHFAPPLLDEAEKALRDAVDLYPVNPLLWMELSRFLQARGRLEEARTAAHRCLALEPYYAEAALQVGRLLRMEGKTERAERWLSSSLPRMQKAQLRGSLPAYTQAILSLSADAYLLEIARCRFDRREWERSLEVLRGVGAPGGETLHLMAGAHYHLGRTREAEKLLVRAIAESPGEKILGDALEIVRAALKRK